MKESELALLKELLATPKKIVIIPHKNPDGDAMGSTLALYQYLTKTGHSANVVSPNDYPKFLKLTKHNDIKRLQWFFDLLEELKKVCK